MTPERLLDIAKAGWTFKERFIDKNPALGLLGIRLTNARKTWEESYSIQIFNRTTVTLAQKANATIDDHVSLTKDDGRDFLEWLRLAHPEVLPQELWDKLPEGEAESAPPPTNDEARNALLQYLVPRYPDFFGPGSMAAAGAPFEATVLALIRNGENIPSQVAENDRVTTRAILYLETAAHDSYKEANAHLRNAHQAMPGTDRLHSAQAAYLAIGTAITLIARALTMRREYELAEHRPVPIPPPNFPEAIEPSEAWAAIEAALGATTENLTRIASPAAIADESGASSGAAIASPAPYVPGRVLTEADITPGMMVTIADPNSPRFKQLAEIYCRVGPGRYALAFKGETGAPQFNLSQLRSIT